MKNIFPILLSLCLLSATAFAQVFDLRCEGQQAPLGIETTNPHFSWKNTLTHNNQQQKAYEIQVASDSAALAKGRADIWKSGRIESDEVQKENAAKMMKRLGNPARFGFPVFVVLDENGKVIHIQDSVFLEEGKSYNKEKVMRFFECWTPKAVK